MLYLDTSIVSGIAKNDLPAHERTACAAILQAEAAGHVELCASPVTKRELSAIPAGHRGAHDGVYNALLIIPEVGDTLLQVDIQQPGRSGIRGPLPVITDVDHVALRSILRGNKRSDIRTETDARHIWEAFKADADYFVTDDRK